MFTEVWVQDAKRANFLSKEPGTVFSHHVNDHTLANTMHDPCKNDSITLLTK